MEMKFTNNNSSTRQGMRGRLLILHLFPLSLLPLTNIQP